MPLFNTKMTTLNLSESRSNPLENPSIPISSPAALQWLSGGDPTASGELINEANALQIVTVYSCVRVLAESVASLPLKLYELLASGKQEAIDAPLYFLLATEPNPEMSAFTFFETLTGSLALTGNAYAQIERNGAGQAIALWPLHPLKTEPVRAASGKIVFKTSDGMALGQHRFIQAEDVLHIPLFSFDGLKGISPISMARQSLGLAKATEKYGAKFFGNGSRPAGVLSTKTVPDPKTKQEIKESWSEQYGGQNQNKTAFLYGDWTYSQISLGPEDSQFLSTRQFQRSEIAALFRVPPNMVGDMTRLSNSNHEQSSLGFVTDTLRPYLARIEGEIIRKLLPTSGRKANKYIVSFDVSERLRGDFATTQAGFATGRQWGWLSGNDVRKSLGLNPGGTELDAYLVPVNMINAKALPSEQPAIQSETVKTDPVTDTERSALGDLSQAYIRLFRDAIGRITARTKRDSDTVQSLFGPVLTSISDEVSRQAALKFDLPDAWNQTQERTIKDTLKGMEKRATDWTPGQSDELIGQEFNRVARSIIIGTYREAGATAALKGLENEQAA